ncbi:MAG: SMP-30/gluconolactonase/LRE family protein [Kiritimatiellae bacterium]|nr:SMP-30/gluconolactonase/LRE family protein [Kiritimatiellia bacterium]
MKQIPMEVHLACNYRSVSHVAGGMAYGFIVMAAGFLLAAVAPEFTIKREEVYGFAQKPTVSREGDAVTIAFETTGFCDVTVAIESGDGRIVRHLASGVLGQNAPGPFQKNSKVQRLVWDGKDDQGRYVDDRKKLFVRVSLGLRPQFERSLFWAPKRRPSEDPPLFAAAPEGVYVYFGGQDIDSVILYDHDGEYVRTVYPFPGDKIEQTRGLEWFTYPQDGKRLPRKTNFMRCTMLTSGSNAGTSYHDHKRQNWDHPLANLMAHFTMYGAAAISMARCGERLALAYFYVNRLAADGTTGGLDLLGPKVAIPFSGGGEKAQLVAPYSIAFSPDGRTLYLTSYTFGKEARATQDIARLADVRTLPVVMKLNYDANESPVVFKGGISLKDDGADNEHFRVPAGVACDAKGRVYVADYMNDRVQIFDPDGRYLKTIPFRRPAHVAIHEKTGEIYVFSWLVRNEYEEETVPKRLAIHKPFPDMTRVGEYELAPAGGFVTGWGGMHPIEFTAALDSWVDPPRIWIAQPLTVANVLNRERVFSANVQIRELRGGKWVTIRDFEEDCKKQRVPPRVAPYYRQRLYVNPANRRLYLAEGDSCAVGKSFHQLFEIDPETGEHKLVQLPFNAEDMCFDLNGLAYLRTINVVGRFDPVQGWREVPWDYGEERTKVGYGWSQNTRTANLTSALVVPADANWHHGGMHVTARGHLIVACGYNVSMTVRTHAKYVHLDKKYEPRVFPGRLMGGRGGATTLHVWDESGKLIAEDIAPGQTDLYGVALDADDNLYLMTSAPRMLPGEESRPYPDKTAGSLVKFPKGRGRVLTKGNDPPVALPESLYPDRPVDTAGGNQGFAWFEEAEWIYGGVGFSGGNIGGCSCWNARFVLDYFARSWAPEVHRYSVAVLDSAGNLILRVGRYGNVDDGRPMILEGGPPNPRPLGGDGVALFHAPYLATDTDRRLFIADPGNFRIVSVKLEYHTQEKIALATGQQ